LSAKLGRNARLLKDGQAIGYGKNISLMATRMFKASNKLLAMIYKLLKNQKEYSAPTNFGATEAHSSNSEKERHSSSKTLESIK